MVRATVTLDAQQCIVAIETIGHTTAGMVPMKFKISPIERIFKRSQPPPPPKTQPTFPTHPDEALQRSICAAISTVEYQFFYALKDLTTLKPSLEIDRKMGIFKLTIPSPPLVAAAKSTATTASITLGDENIAENNANELIRWQTLSRALILGYQMILSQYAKHFSIVWKHR